MSLARSFLNDFRPLFRLIEDPFFASPSYTLARGHGARFSPESWFERQASVKLSDDGNDIIVQTEMPGVKKEDLDVHLGRDGQSLTISGRVYRFSSKGSQAAAPVAPSDSANSNTVADVVKSDAEQTSGESEFRSSLTRTLWLPQPVDAKKAKAELSDGVLTLRIPTRE